uniref:Uncharacterized protein n=1 Tax=Lepeophtheirus salmonis TaxID=72036 RepID=A0A0K2UVH6_LEPSM
MRSIKASRGLMRNL